MTTKFKSEQELVDTYTDRLQRRSSSSLFQWIHEFESPNGIADIVTYRLRKDWSKHSSLQFIPPRWAFALRSLPYRRAFTADYFAKISGASSKTAKSVLELFKQAGYCEYNQDLNSWIKKRQPVKPICEINAVEAKLRDWKRALKQAYRYLDYANKSWVLLDEKYAAPAIANLDQFQRLNIGLATISKSNNMNVIWKPHPKQPKSEISNWHASASLTKLAIENSPFESI